MSAFKMSMEVELRPCKVDGKRALFHRWGSFVKIITDINRKPMSSYHDITVGIVEFEDGKIEKVNPADIEFISTTHNEYIWD